MGEFITPESGPYAAVRGRRIDLEPRNEQRIYTNKLLASWGHGLQAILTQL
jgi:hypothetical protein